MQINILNNEYEDVRYCMKPIWDFTLGVIFIRVVLWFTDKLYNSAFQYGSPLDDLSNDESSDEGESSEEDDRLIQLEPFTYNSNEDDMSMGRVAENSEGIIRNGSTQVSKHSPLVRDLFHSVCNYEDVIESIPDNMYERMIFYEDYSNKNITNVGYGEPYIVRLKGRKFKDMELNVFMFLQKVGQQVMKEFHAQTAIILKNEIILVFNGDLKLDNNLFNGNTTKLGSIISSFASSIFSINTNLKCAFEASVIDFPKITSDTRHLTFDYINYIRTKCKESRFINVTPVVIKRTREEDLSHSPTCNYKHIKFTLDKIKANSYYNVFFTTSTFFESEYRNKIKFNKFYEIDMNIE